MRWFVTVVGLLSCTAVDQSLDSDASIPVGGDAEAEDAWEATNDADVVAEADAETDADVTQGPAPDMIPMPKEYRQTGGLFELDGQRVFIEEGNRQCEIGAEELALRIEQLGSVPGEVEPVSDVALPGIYLLPITSDAARQLALELSLEVTPDDPGPQGYIIHTSPERLIIIGSDNIGTLYGAMTLRQMIQSGDDGIVNIAAADVYDEPDYHYRSTVSFYRGLGWWGREPEDYQEGIDLMMRFKLNVLWDFQAWLDPREVGPNKRSFFREMTAYAQERGISAMHGQDSTAIGTEYDYEQGYSEFQDWDCVGGGRNHHFYCWSRDELTLERANRLIDLIQDCGFSIFFLHPVDGGGIDDPEQWSRRCDQCRQRFGDERWRASAHQFNLWADVIRDRELDLIFTIPIYPYSSWGSYYEDCTTPDCETRRRNSVEYWQNLHREMDPDIVPMVWMGQPERMSSYRSYFDGRPVAIYAHSIRVLGYFGTWHRMNRTHFTSDPRDLLMLTGGNLTSGQTWMNQLLSVEFSWNTTAPGSEDFEGFRYDSERDHTEPALIMEAWVPRALRLLYGEEVGDRIAPLFQAGVLPKYIETPLQAIETSNHYRRKPDEDWVEPGEGTNPRLSTHPIEDTAERMGRQVTATQTAWDALESAYPYIDTLDPYRRQTFIDFYRRMPLWNLLAKARYATRHAAELDEAGDHAAAEQVLQQALEQLAEDRELVSQVLQQTSEEPNLQPIDDLRDRANSIDSTLVLPEE